VPGRRPGRGRGRGDGRGADRGGAAVAVVALKGKVGQQDEVAHEGRVAVACALGGRSGGARLEGARAQQQAPNGGPERVRDAVERKLAEIVD
jgi:hypothetical protein